MHKSRYARLYARQGHGLVKLVLNSHSHRQTFMPNLLSALDGKSDDFSITLAQLIKAKRKLVMDARATSI